MLLTFNNSAKRSNILAEAKVLKTKGEIYKKIFIKKDSHPIVRKEWGRLFSVFNDEKAKPVNIGHIIDFDIKNRRILRDVLIIDTWNANFH